MKPGDCISVDQMQSTTAGFIGQLKGRLSRKRYQTETVFTDHFSRHTYIHLQQTLSSADTISAKHVFEAFANKHGVAVTHYHADNGRFADNMFMNDVASQQQTISFCGVNAHFQNGIAEKKIKDMTELARKQLLHAKNKWPKAIHVALWPYALRNGAHIYNNLPNSKHGLFLLEAFSNSKISPNLKTHHTFGCPTYVLRNELPNNQSLPRWESRA